MPDFRVADTAPEHPKLRAAGLAAAGLWSMAGAYSMNPAQLTDGWVPDYWVQSWPGGRRSAVRLVEVGLWTRETRGGLPGYQFHDWHSIQRSAAQIEEEKVAARERAKRSREKYAARGRGSAPHGAAVRAPNVHDSLSLTLTQSPSGTAGGERSGTERDATRDEPPAPNLDPTNPRCAEHRDIPATERGPNCRACRAVRDQLEQQPGPRRDLEARGCPWCDADGWRIDPENRHRGALIPGVRCDHTPLVVAEAAS